MKWSGVKKVVVLISALASSCCWGDCSRTYAQVQEIRLFSGRWQLGTTNAQGQWIPLRCRPNLNTSFFDGTNRKVLDRDGESHIGRDATFVLFPDTFVPKGTYFVIRPPYLYGKDQIQVTLPEVGAVFLDRKKYEHLETTINGVGVEIFSEPDNPAKEAAIQTLEIFTRLFPHRTAAMSRQGKIMLVLARNSTEKFQAAPIIANGFHFAAHLYAVQFSQDGTHVLEHSFHEIGGLFRIPPNIYDHGLTWMAAFDQEEKLAPSADEKRALQCAELDRVVGNLRSTAASGEKEDYSESIEYYLQDWRSRNGWAMYAWGSAFFWMKINAALEAEGLPSIYRLIDNIHEQGMPEVAGGRDLDRLIAAYQRLSPGGCQAFATLAKRYFRDQNLGELLREVSRERGELGCK